MSAAVGVHGVSKAFGGVPVLSGVELSVAEGEFVCLLGGSGSGKSTLLNIIAGLETSDSGSVSAPPSAVMFQEPALLPWLTAAGNVGLALRLAGMPRTERAVRVRELLTLVRLGGAGHHLAHQLSGGMKQRVALARALAQNRRLLLMDEPFSALDSVTRDLLHGELEDIWRATGRTIILVTHNVPEAIRLAQRVVLLSSDRGSVAGEWTVGPGQRANRAERAALAEEITAALSREVHAHAAVA